MTKYWCVNFDSEACLQHGIQQNLWMMQYQYADDHGNEYQGYKKGAIRRNWERLGKISPGDWFVAYLKPQTFYAIGKVITPRRGKTDHDYTDTIGGYLDRQKSHDHCSGCVYYTPVFYEDFTDKWRHPEDELTRYPQRVDVEEWRYCVPGGVSVQGLNKIPPNELRLAVFALPKGYFQRIARELAGGRVLLLNEQGAGEVETGTDEAIVDALEKSYAKSQGFILDSKLRKALELYAMEEAKRYFESSGYVVKDDSKNHPYDLHCKRGKELLYVEVKGTQTKGEGIILTAGEVEFARCHKGQMALFVLHSIRVLGDGKEFTLAEGQMRRIVPWDVDEGCLKPVSFVYEVPTSIG